MTEASNKPDKTPKTIRSVPSAVAGAGVAPEHHAGGNPGPQDPQWFCALREHNQSGTGTRAALEPVRDTGNSGGKCLVYAVNVHLPSLVVE